MRPLILILSLALLLRLVLSIELAPDPTAPTEAPESRNASAAPAPPPDPRGPDGGAESATPTFVEVFSAAVLGTVTDHRGRPVEEFEVLPPRLLLT